MSDEEIDADRVVVTQTRTIDADPDEIDDEWVANHFDGDKVQASDRVTGRMVGYAGDRVYHHVCPACGEECTGSISDTETRYYSHTENEDCELDTSQYSRSVSTKTQSRRILNLVIGGGVTVIVAGYVMSQLRASDVLPVGSSGASLPEAFGIVALVFVAVIVIGVGALLADGSRFAGGGLR